MEPWQVETWSKTCLWSPGGLIFTHTQISVGYLLGGLKGNQETNRMAFFLVSQRRRCTHPPYSKYPAFFQDIVSTLCKGGIYHGKPGLPKKYPEKSGYSE